MTASTASRWTIALPHSLQSSWRRRTPFQLKHARCDLSTLKSILPAFTSVTAFPTSMVTVPDLGLGMRPRGPDSAQHHLAHDLGSGNDYVHIGPSALDLRHVLVQPNVVGTGVFCLLLFVRRAKHQHTNVFACPVRRLTIPRTIWFAFEVNAEAHCEVPVASNLVVEHSLTSTEASSKL